MIAALLRLLSWPRRVPLTAQDDPHADAHLPVQDPYVDELVLPARRRWDEREAARLRRFHDPHAGDGR